MGKQFSENELFRTIFDYSFTFLDARVKAYHSRSLAHKLERIKENPESIMKLIKESYEEWKLFNEPTQEDLPELPGFDEYCAMNTFDKAVTDISHIIYDYVVNSKVVTDEEDDENYNNTPLEYL